MTPVVVLPVTYNLILGSVAITGAGRRSAEGITEQLRKGQHTREGQREPGRQRKQQEQEE